MSVLVRYNRVIGENTFLVAVDDLFPGSARCAFSSLANRFYSEERFDPGYLIDESGPGEKPCSHANIKGRLDLTNASDLEEGEILHKFNDPWHKRDQSVVCKRIEGTEYFDPTPLLGEDLITSAYQAALFTPWYLIENNFVSVSMDGFEYIHTYKNQPNTTGLAEGVRTHWVSTQVIEHDWIVEFVCDGRRQRTVNPYYSPTKWGEWEDIGTKTFSFRKVSVTYSTLCSAYIQVCLNALLAEAGFSIARCIAEASKAPLTRAIADACDQVQFVDMNNIENATQMADLSNILPLRDIFRVVKNYDDPYAWAKSTAGLYLYYKYAIKPTVKDVRTLIDARHDWGKRLQDSMRKHVYRSAGSNIHEDIKTNYGASVTVIPSANQDVVGKALTYLDELGLALDPSNAWDLVPYSFVVDWFINSNDMLRVISTYCHSYRYTVVNCHTFVKSQFNYLASVDDVPVGRLNASYYERSYSSSLPSLKLQGSEGWHSNLITGEALIVGRL